MRETIDNCLHEAMDLDGLLEVLREIENGAIRTVAIDTPEPSAFCHEILNANPYAYLDDAPLEERRTRAVTLRRTTARRRRRRRDPRSGRDRRGRGESRGRVVRDADELHDALATLIVVPPVAQWHDVVRRARRAATRDAAASPASASSGRAPNGSHWRARYPERPDPTAPRAADDAASPRRARRRSPKSCAAGSNRAAR